MTTPGINLGDVDQKDEAGRAAIHCAASQANIEALRQLIKGGANIKLKTLTGWTIFDCLKSSRLADTNRVRDCLKLLIENYDFVLSDLNDKNIVKNLLIESPDEEDNELYELIMSKANKELVNEVTLYGKPLLHHFMSNKQFNRIELLLKQGAYVDAKFKSGNTPLMGLIKIQELPEKYDLIRLFIQYKADLDKITDNEGNTVMKLVEASKDEKIKQFFSDYAGFEKQSLGMKS